MARRGAKLGTSVLDLDIDDSRFHSKMSGAYKAAQNFTSQTGANLMKAGKAMSGLGESWSRNVTLPIVAAGGLVTKFGLDFDTTMSQVVGLTSVTREQIGGIREELLKLGPEVGKSPQELAEAFYFVASAGFEGAEAMEILRATSKAAAAGLGDTASVAKVIGSAVNAYGLEASAAAGLTDTLVAAIGEGSAEAPEFAGALGNVIGSAAQIGAKFSDVTGAIAAMTNVGISAEESVTALNQVFMTLFKPTTEAAEALDEMGLSAASLRQMIADKGLMPTLGMLAEKFDGNAEATATVFGNVRALKGVLALTGPQLESTSALIGRVGDAQGATNDAFREFADSDSGKAKMAMAELEATAISIGSDVLPVVVEVLQELAAGARALSKWWGTLDDDTKQLVIRSLAFVAVAGPILIVVGKLTTGLGMLIKAVAFLGGPKGLARMGPAFGAMLGPLGLAIVAVGALAAVLVELGETLDPDTIDVRDMLNDTGDMGKAMDQLKDLAEQTGEDWFDVGVRVKAAMDELGLSFEQAVDHVEREARALPSLFDEIPEGAQEAWDRLRAGAEAGADGATQAIADLPPEVVAVLEDAGIPIGAAADGTMGEIDEAALAAREAAIKHMAAMLTGIAGMFDSDESVREAWQALIDRMDDPYTEAERKADIFGTDMTEGIRDGLATGDPALILDTTDLVNRLLGEFALMEPGALESGEAVPPALREGMDREMSALIDYIEREVTGESLAAMELDAVPPGLEAIASYARGMARNQRLATSQAARTGNAALDALIVEQSWINAGRSIVDLIVNGVDQRTWYAQSAMRGLAQVMRAPMPESEPKDPRSALRGLGKSGAAIVDLVSGGVFGELGTARAAMLALSDILNPTLGSWHVPSIATPALPSAADMAGSFTAADGLGTTIEHTEYHLHYNGRDQTFDTREAFMDELEGLARFNDGSVG